MDYVKPHCRVVTDAPHASCSLSAQMGHANFRWNALLRSEGQIYSKTKGALAMIAPESGFLDTKADGMVEQRSAVGKGDYIIHGSRGARYPMRQEVFVQRYDVSKSEPVIDTDSVLAAEGFRLFPPIGKVVAYILTHEDVAMDFPFGEFANAYGNHSVSVGDALAMSFPDGGEVYSIPRELFGRTYVHDGESSPSAMHASTEYDPGDTTGMRTGDGDGDVVACSNDGAKKNEEERLGQNLTTLLASLAVDGPRTGREAFLADTLSAVLHIRAEQDDPRRTKIHEAGHCHSDIGEGDGEPSAKQADDDGPDEQNDGGGDCDGEAHGGRKKRRHRRSREQIRQRHDSAGSEDDARHVARSKPRRSKRHVERKASREHMMSVEV